MINLLLQHASIGTIAGILLGLITACGSTFPQRGFPPPEDPIPGLMPPIPSPDHEKLESVAYHHYGQGDYVRALGFAYNAHEAAPSNPRYPVLLGLIYDHGLDRPDLAVLEYQKLLNMDPSAKLAQTLSNRIQHLRRVSYQREARQRIFQTGQAPPPKDTSPVVDIAIYPLQSVGPKQPTDGLALGIIDMLIHDIRRVDASVGIDPLRLHIFHGEFSRHRPGDTAEEFARWIKAPRTLSGTLMDLGDHRIRITLKVMGQDGGTLYEAPPVTVDLRDLQTLRNTLAGQALKGLNLTQPSTYPSAPFSNPVNLLVHSEALSLYIQGDIPAALRTLESIRRFEPDSQLMDRTLGWARRDIAGAGSLPGLLKAFKDLGTLPNPLDAVHRRLVATHALTTPTPASRTGTETLNPYKPPPPEVAP